MSKNNKNYKGLFILLGLMAVASALVLWKVSSDHSSLSGNPGSQPYNPFHAKLQSYETTHTKFEDVGGIDEVVEELEEVVDFLREPERFTRLGARIPKGVLLVGPPGTGKTLIAKAVAGEAGCPFYSISGSEFIEQFVGVGASRVRSLFKEARATAPSIIFIDEIDAIGEQRGFSFDGGERLQTLNELLIQMDGFEADTAVIVIAATNRAERLDKALVRPGRFDRHVHVPYPDLKGRKAILGIYAEKMAFVPDMDLSKLAETTPGASGAELHNILNEAALIAAKEGEEAIEQKHVEEARDKVLFGKVRNISWEASDRKATAYHEAGHVIVGQSVRYADPLEKVSIVPRGQSLGQTIHLPKNRTNYWKEELYDQLAVLMGGRVAEEVFIGDVSTGASDDMEKATRIARGMVSRWGMSDKIGYAVYDPQERSMFSDETAKAIDAEVKLLLDKAYARARRIIQERRREAEAIARMLLEKETLDSEEIKAIIRNERKHF